MRFGTSLFSALVLAGALASAARAQGPGASTGTYSVYGPYSTRYPSPSSPTPTSTNPDSSLRTAGL